MSSTVVLLPPPPYGKYTEPGVVNSNVVFSPPPPLSLGRFFVVVVVRTPGPSVVVDNA